MKQFCISKFEFRYLAYTKLCNDFISYFFSVLQYKKGKNESVPNFPIFATFIFKFSQHLTWLVLNLLIFYLLLHPSFPLRPYIILF